VTRKVLQAGDKVEIARTVSTSSGSPRTWRRSGAGKETLDLSTGLFAPFDDPSGAFRARRE